MLELIIRWIFILQMLFAGLNGIFHFRPVPDSGPQIDAFVKACMDVKFIMPTIKALEVIGALVLINKHWVPFGLILFAPMMFVITLLHAMHNPKPWGVLVAFSLPYVLLIYLNHEALTARLFA
ncbi:hypothetical protein D3C72_1457380 [compost metagenome]